MGALIIIAWLLSPFFLVFWAVREHRKRDVRDELLMRLYVSGRISADELHASGIEIPPELQSVFPAQLPVPPPAPHAFAPSDPEAVLAEAAKKAAIAAESAIAVPDAQPYPEAVSEPETETVPEPESEDIRLPEANETPDTEAAPAADLIPEAESEAEYRGILGDAPVPYRVSPPQRQTGFNVSAITVMLSVGVVLIVVAGLLFVRSAWSSLSDFGRLLTLAAGSGLFFGASALARRVWKLERTGMAFFTLGAAFLPISVWAAGYFHLLGDALSGASNRWLIALSFASFSVIALIAVRIYKQLGWGIASLCGLTLTYLYAASAASKIITDSQSSAAVFLIAAAVLALGFAYSSRVVRYRLPLAIGRAYEPFAVGYTGCAGAAMLSTLAADRAWGLCAAAVFCTAAAFFAAPMAERLKQASAVPVTLLGLLGFGKLLHPLLDQREIALLIFSDTQYAALLCMICAGVWLILLTAKLLPAHIRTGAQYAGYALIGTSLAASLLDPDPNVICLIAVICMLLLILLHTRKIVWKPASILLAGVCFVLACQIYVFVDFYTHSDHKYAQQQLLLFAVLMMLNFGIFRFTKKHCTAVSDLLFTVTAGIAAIDIVSDSRPAPAQIPALLILALLILLYWALALAHDTHKPIQHVYAVLTPVTLLAAVLASQDMFLHADSVTVTIVWSLLSFVVGFGTYFTTKKRFHTVRRLLFGLTVVPPVLLGIFGNDRAYGNPMILRQLICIAAALAVWQIFAARGRRYLSAASFSTALLLVTETTYFILRDRVFDGKTNFIVVLTASLWILLLGMFSIVIAKRKIFFVGDRILTLVMQFATPAAALILSVVLCALDESVWDSVYFVYLLIFVVTAWFVTQRSQIVMPCVSMFALLLTLEAFRFHNANTSTGAVIFLLLSFSGMTLLFPYLGTIVRSMTQHPEEERRSWSLTVFGGAVPFWLALVAAGIGDVDYSYHQMRWMLFFVPALLAGYVLHFVSFTESETNQRTLKTVAAALCTVAFWMQPLIHVEDTYFEGKLHILPLIAFGIVLRRLYGAKTGGDFLFAVGVYAMLRLAGRAIITEQPEDLVTILVTGLVMFIASFYIKQKKWFLLGGISLLLTAVYMHMRLTDGTQWWVYLLLAGLILIVVAASNEMLKQRGDSLRSRAGRLWEDWTW